MFVLHEDKELLNQVELILHEVVGTVKGLKDSEEALF
jgi:hypothetical protein